MELKDLLKRIIDTCNYNEVSIDTDLSLEYVCQIAEPLVNKDTNEISELIIFPLMSQYRDSEDIDEQEYIQDTIKLILKYINY